MTGQRDAEAGDRPERSPIEPSGLNVFSPQERARLVRLRDLVRATRGSPPATATESRLLRAARAFGRCWVPVATAALIGSGVLGILHTSAAMDDLRRSSVVAVAPVSLAERLLPGLIAHPASYLSAVNGGGAGQRNGAAGDDLFALGMLDLKAAMDRSEAALAAGVGLLLLAATATSPPATSPPATDPDTSLAADAAPFLLIAAFLCAALSFLELP